MNRATIKYYPPPRPLVPIGRINADFTLKTLVINFVLMTFLFFVNRVGLAGNLVCYGILTLMALRSGPGTIKALSLSTIVLFANPYLIEIHPVVTFFRFALLLTAGSRILLDAQRLGVNFLRLPHLNVLVFFGIICVCLAFLNRYYLTISLLKISTFTFGAYVLLIASDIYKNSAATLACWFTGLSCFFILANLVAYALGIGYIVHRTISATDAGVGLSGITGHPQTLGTITALLSIFCLCIHFFTPYRLRWIAGLCILPLLALCYASAARTGFLASALAVLFALGMIFLPQRGIRRKWLINITPVQAFGAILAFGSCLVLVDITRDGILRGRIENFLLKSVRSGENTVDFSSDEMFSSRIALIEFSWHNFLQKPLTGIGFGTSYEPGFIETATLFTAPVEKGFLPTAILEETGVPGTTMFLLFLILLYRYLWRSRNLMSLIILSVAILINMGEVVLFSLGGLGLLVWCVIASATIIGRNLPLPLPVHPRHTHFIPSGKGHKNHLLTSKQNPTSDSE